MADKSRLTKLIEAQSKARDRVNKAARKAARTRTASMKDADWRDYDEVTTYAADQKRIVNAYQRQIAALVNAYQARQLTMLTDRTATPVGQINVEGLRGIPDTSTYGRMAEYYRYLRDNPDRLYSVADAAELVADRAETVADLDLLLAHREQEFKFLSGKRNLTGWRYVIHPELATKSGASCGLCIAASQKVYSVKRRRAIHANCNCEAVPTGEFADLGLELNQDDLNEIYEAAGTTNGRALKETRFSIREHGELGPVLTYRGNRFRGPKQVESDTTNNKPVPLD